MDLLLSFSDFASFKEMMLFARAHLVATTPKVKSAKAAALGLKDGKKAEGKGSGKQMAEAELKHFEEHIDKLQISGTQKRVYKEEQEEGTEMPDLQLDIKKI